MLAKAMSSTFPHSGPSYHLCSLPSLPSSLISTSCRWHEVQSAPDRYARNLAVNFWSLLLPRPSSSFFLLLPHVPPLLLLLFFTSTRFFSFLFIMASVRYTPFYTKEFPCRECRPYVNIDTYSRLLTEFAPLSAQHRS